MITLGAGMMRQMAQRRLTPFPIDPRDSLPYFKFPPDFATPPAWNIGKHDYTKIQVYTKLFRDGGMVSAGAGLPVSGPEIMRQT
jgi:hypothetical protein